MLIYSSLNILSFQDQIFTLTYQIFSRYQKYSQMNGTYKGKRIRHVHINEQDFNIQSSGVTRILIPF